ncbi:MAG TPA: PqiC family protein [Caulobacteraceae bacterium]|nr:PqiC family protein [Caulobacteraceae bacterium]
MLYTIAPVQGPVQPGGPKVIVLQQIATAHYLERSQIVRSSENYRLDVMSNDWWGEPLAGMLSRVLTEELGQRLPQSTVIGETGAVSASPDATIELNVQRLDEDASGNVVLQAQASVNFKGRPGPVLRSFRFVVTPPAVGIQGEVTAISTALGQLADGIASVLVGR